MSNVTPIGEAPSAQADDAPAETPRPTGPPSANALALLEKLRGVARVNAEHRGRGHAILQVARPWTRTPATPSRNCASTGPTSGSRKASATS